MKERLRIAGATGEIFTPEAVRAVHNSSTGIPRLVNLLSEHALIQAFADQKNPIPEAIIREVALDFNLRGGESFLQETPVAYEPNGHIASNGAGSNLGASSQTPKPFKSN
jgi:hypothetical protein